MTWFAPPSGGYSGLGPNGEVVPRPGKPPKTPATASGIRAATQREEQPVDDVEASLRYGHRRRCSWCGVVLRGWQLNSCRRCKQFTRIGTPGPPCPQASRWEAKPDARR